MIISGDKASKVALQIFQYLRKQVRWDAEILELMVTGNILRPYVRTETEDQRLWLSFMDKE